MMEGHKEVVDTGTVSMTAEFFCVELGSSLLGLEVESTNKEKLASS